MRRLVPVGFLLVLLFAGAYFAGYPVPGENAIDSLQGADVVSVPEQQPDRLTDPETREFRRWVEFYVHVYVNQERVDHGAGALEFDAALRDIARDYSGRMANRSFFAHVSPSGSDPGDRYRAAEYHCVRGAGENLAYTYFDRRVRTEEGEVVRYRSARGLARGVVSQWMHSPDHRKNLLSGNWDREGVGVYYEEETDRVFVTQNFC
jgi:uncharacterized protein YkwD